MNFEVVRASIFCCFIVTVPDLWVVCNRSALGGGAFKFAVLFLSFNKMLFVTATFSCGYVPHSTGF